MKKLKKLLSEHELRLKLQHLRESSGLSREQVARRLKRNYRLPLVDLQLWEQVELPDLPLLLCLLDFYHVDDLNTFFGFRPALSPLAVRIGTIVDLGQRISPHRSYQSLPQLKLNLEYTRKWHSLEIADLVQALQITEQEYLSYERNERLPDVMLFTLICKQLRTPNLNDMLRYRMYPRLSETALTTAIAFDGQGTAYQSDLVLLLQETVASHSHDRAEDYCFVLADTLSKVRADTLLPLDEFADEIGINARVLSLWERGKVLPSLLHLITYAEHFGISVDYLLSRVGEKDKYL